MKFSWLTIVAPRSPRSRATYAPAKPPPRTSTPPLASRTGTRTFYQSRPEEVALEVRGCELERAPVRGIRLVPAAEAAQEVRPRRVEEVVVVEALDGVDELETLLEPVCERHRDRPVQLDDRRRGEIEKPCVEEGDLRPVDRFVGIQRRDRRLQLVRPGDPQRERPLECRATLLDLVEIPESPILIGEQNEPAIRRDPGVAARVLEEKEGVQPVRLGLVGHER